MLAGIDLGVGAVLLRTVTPMLIAPAILLFAGLTPSRAMARTRLAVLITAEDTALADDLSEVAISHLVQRDEWELVGGRELRGRLAAIVPGGGLRACVAEPACRAALASTAQVDRAIVGEVGQRDGSFVVDLTLVDLRTGAAEARSSEAVPADQTRLISAVRAGIDRLFAPKAAPPEPAPLVLAAAPIPPAPAAPRVSLRHDEDPPADRRESLLPYLGLGAAGGAVVSFSAAAVTGSLATQSLAGASRAQMQMDLQRREGYATATNVLLGAGTVCATAAAVLLYRWWHGTRRAPPTQPIGDSGLTR